MFFRTIPTPNFIYIFLDNEVGKIFTQISVTESEAYIKLDEKDFYEKKLINLRKKWILEGLDPDEEEAKLFKKKERKDKKNRKRRLDKKKNKDKATECS